MEAPFILENAPMSQLPSVSLCVIFRNDAKTIRKLLNSVLNAKVPSKTNGPAFTEYVFVNTGSTDGTEKIIADALELNGGFGQADFTWPTETREFIYPHETRDGITPRVVLANFEWVDDFSAARQFSFDLATSDWRMYLDTDDVVAEAGAIRPTLARTIETHSKCNAVTMVYDYAPTITQDVRRLVRWADGWRWEDELHESLVLPKNRGAVVSGWKGLIVSHQPGEGATERSLERNIRIAEKALFRATLRQDPDKVRFWSFYLGQYAGRAGKLDEAIDYLETAADGFGNIACLAAVTLSQIHQSRGEFVEAAQAAGNAIAADSEMREGYAQIASVQKARGNIDAAAGAFTRFLAMPPQALHAGADIAFLEGSARLEAAEVFVATGDFTAARKTLNGIPAQIRQLDTTKSKFDALDSSIGRNDFEQMANKLAIQEAEQCAAGNPTMAKQIGIRRFKALFEYLIWDTEPMKALDLFNLMPAALADAPELTDLLLDLKEKMRHLKSWEQYQKAYSEIPMGAYHTDEAHVAGVKLLGRYKRMQEWAKDQNRSNGCSTCAECDPYAMGHEEADCAKRGDEICRLCPNHPPIYVCAIGAQDCIIERGMMEANPRIHLCAVDVAPQAAKGIQALIADYPDRVTTHEIKHDHYDWPLGYDDGKSEVFPAFDAVTLFEVIEHLPSDFDALKRIRQMLKLGGKLFLSTPVAEMWVESYLTDKKSPMFPPFYGHVRAHNALTLGDLAVECGFIGPLHATDNQSIFFGEWTKMPIVPIPEKKNIAIYATAEPFDPDSIAKGHVGGSEEAIIFLARELGELGHTVTVFVPRNPNTDTIFHAEDSVLYRDASEFNPRAWDKDSTVIYWRCPEIGLEDRVQKAKHKKVLWCHDEFYFGDPKREAYEAFDAVLSLSATHEDTLMEFDGCPAEKFVRVDNGIAPEMFPELDETNRKPHRAIYASSPDRGLSQLLDVWPKVRAEIPDAELKIFYDWRLLERARPAQAAALHERVEALASSGVEFIGGVSHERLHREYREAGVWPYFPTEFRETFCISIAKAAASGCWPIFVDNGALKETNEPLGGDVLPKNGDFAKAIIDRMTWSPNPENRKALRERAISAYSWEKVAADFSRIL